MLKQRERFIHMQLTTELLNRFVGGQCEIHSERDEYIFCGEVKSAIVEGLHIELEFSWVASGVGGVPPRGWKKHDHHQRGITLIAADIFEEVGGVISIATPISKMKVRFFPPHIGPLDPKKVEGLEWPS